MGFPMFLFFHGFPFFNNVSIFSKVSIFQQKNRNQPKNGMFLFFVVFPFFQQKMETETGGPKMELWKLWVVNIGGSWSGLLVARGT
jgi:hypothetical protein